jgi:transcriptional regulator with XRE-family HTH domain
MNSKLNETAQRVDWVLKKVWSGSQTRMAEDIGVSQSAISNVVTGRQQPGRKLLAAVSSNSLINSTWLITGEGDPLITLGTEPGRRALYVARRLFEGHPEDNGDCLGSMMEVPIPYYRPSRYWMQVHSDSPLVNHEPLKIAVDDFVLFEPDQSGWPEHVVDHPCIFKGGGRELRIDCIAKQRGRRIWTGGTAISQSRKPVVGREHRSIQLDEKPTAADTSLSLSMKSLVAVGLFRMGGFGSDDSTR